MQDCNKEWGGQTCLNIVEHEDVLKAAQRKMNGMTPTEAYEGLLDAYAEVSSLESSLVRGSRTCRNTRSLFSTGISFSWNYQACKTIRNTTTPLAPMN